MDSSGLVPPGFTFSIERKGLLRFKLTASQFVSIRREQAFRFFEDPSNLSHIIPEWVHFRFDNNGKDTVVQNNAEFNYTLSWLGMPLRWRSRIIHYKPPERFTDVQLRGPYSSWEHTHIIDEAPEGSLMRDEILYTIPLIAVPIHGFIIKKQLEEIFRYRAEKIAEWASSQNNGSSHEE